MFRNYLVNLIVDLIINIHIITDTHLSFHTVDCILDSVRCEFATRDLRGE